MEKVYQAYVSVQLTASCLNTLTNLGSLFCARCSLDQQHEKGINLLEFVAATLNADDISDDEILRTAFRIFDSQHTGGITHQNLKGRLQQYITTGDMNSMLTCS